MIVEPLTVDGNKVFFFFFFFFFQHDSQMARGVSPNYL